MFDVPKTLKGNWYSGEKGIGSASTEYMMALVPDYIDPTTYQLSLKGPESLGTFVNIKFKPTHEGNINREYEEVTNNGEIYCYQDAYNTSSYTDKNGNIVSVDSKKFIIQLIDDMHLNIERQSGVCNGEETLTSPIIFER